MLTNHIATVASTKALHTIAMALNAVMISADLKSKLENLVRDVVKSGEIVDVLISEQSDFEDLDSLNVKVIYESKSKRLDPKEVAGITTKARRVLLENDDGHFPVFYFILRSEAGGLIAAE